MDLEKAPKNNLRVDSVDTRPETVKTAISSVKRISGNRLLRIDPFQTNGVEKRAAIPKPKMMIDFGKLNGSKEEVYIKKVTNAAPTSMKVFRKLAAR